MSEWCDECQKETTRYVPSGKCRSCASRTQWVALTPEERSAIGQERYASQAPEQRAAFHSAREHALELEGQTFGRLTVLARHPERKAGHIRWLCACSCGGSAVANGSDLARGFTLSCGCLQREVRRKNGLARMASLSPDGRTALGRKASAASYASTTPEQRRDSAQKANEAALRKYGGPPRLVLMTPEERVALARKAANTRDENGLTGPMKGGYRTGRRQLAAAIDRKREHIAALEAELAHITHHTKENT